jgi:golgi phosphoprotein 3
MSTTGSTLYLHEELMLMVLRDREGTMASSSTFSYAAGGAVLAELMLQKRIEVELDKKKKFARVCDPRPVGDPLLDACLARLATAKRRAQLATWVSRFAGTRKLKHLVAGQLVRRGILRVDQDKVLGIFRRTIYPELDPRPERLLNARLERAILGADQDVDTRTAVLISLAASADLLQLVIDKKQLKRRRERIALISNGDLTGQATREAIEAMQAAVMIACIMPAIMVSTTTSH